MKPDSILEAALYVDDLDSALRFYSGVIGLKLHSSQAGSHYFFYCGETMLLIFQRDAAQQKSSSIPPHGTSGAGHLAFAVEEETLLDWRKHLESHHIEIEHEHRWPSGGLSIYFRDPSGNSIELATPGLWF